VSDALLAAARDEAGRLEHPYVGTEHLLLALLKMGEPSLIRALADAGVAPDHARSRLEKGRRGRRPPVRPGEDGQPGLTTHARRALEAAGGEPAALVTTLKADQGSLLARLLGPAVERRPASEGDAPAELETEVAAPVRESPRPPREPKKRKERPPRPERPPREAKSARAEPRPSTSRPPEDDDDEPPFVPRLAVQPRKPWKFPWRALLLLLVPATIYLNVTGADPLLLFVVAALGVLPLAAYLGEATEHIAARTGPTLGGLLNATFGNAAELIIAIMALQAGLVTLVKATIIGSMLGNLLLILGLSLLAGGVKSPILRFNRTAAGMSSAMLALAVVALVLPAMLFQVHPRPDELNAFRMSEVAAIILGLTYLGSLLFSLHTHRSLFGGDPEHAPTDTWPASRSVLVLLLATAAVVVQSEVLVHAVEQVTVTLGWSELFLGLIIIPLIGNAAEHASAILVARKGKMDLALHIALGSSTQIALLVAPVLVAVGLVIGVRMDLVFTPFEVMSLAMATIVTAIITLDGESHWYEGVQLLAVYALVAAAAWFI
jgi:Ca2+:H+ antiporter